MMVDFVLAGLLLILVGVVAILAGVLMSSGPGERRLRGGGVVLVGPIPVALGSDARWASIAIALAIVLVVVILLFYAI